MAGGGWRVADRHQSVAEWWGGGGRVHNPSCNQIIEFSRAKYWQSSLLASNNRFTFVRSLHSDSTSVRQKSPCPLVVRRIAPLPPCLTRRAVPIWRPSCRARLVPFRSSCKVTWSLDRSPCHSAPKGRHLYIYTESGYHWYNNGVERTLGSIDQSVDTGHVPCGTTPVRVLTYTLYFLSVP